MILLSPYNSVLFIMFIWILVWLVFMLAGRNIKHRLPTDPLLVRYSSGVFVSITLFYFSIFGTIGIFGGYSSQPIVILFGVLFIIFGFLLLTFARWQLRNLTLTEVFFSNNARSTQIQDGLYHYVKHPMYIGIYFILIGSLFLYPNILAVLFFLITLLCIEKKKAIESHPTK